MKMGDATFKPGPVPRNSWAPPAGSHDAIYSGLLECPVSTRITKLIDHEGYVTVSNGTCGEDMMVVTAKECFAAIANMTGSGETKTATGSDTSLPAGCSVRQVRDFVFVLLECMYVFRTHPLFVIESHTAPLLVICPFNQFSRPS